MNRGITDNVGKEAAATDEKPESLSGRIFKKI